MWTETLYHFYRGQYSLNVLRQSMNVTREKTGRSSGDIARAIIGEPVNVNIYTDGACSSNGKSSAKGGIGVFFGENDFRNISEPQPDPPYTNNRSELIALERVFDYIISNDKIVKRLYSSITIHTDSTYSLKALDETSSGWLKGWKARGYSGVKNVDLIKRIHEKNVLSAKIIPISIKYIAAHKGNYGNEQADELAVAGAKKYE